MKEPTVKVMAAAYAYFPPKLNLNLVVPLPDNTFAATVEREIVVRQVQRAIRAYDYEQGAGAMLFA